jgi:hypothetical protein
MTTPTGDTLEVNLRTQAAAFADTLNRRLARIFPGELPQFEVDLRRGRGDRPTRFKVAPRDPDNPEVDVGLPLVIDDNWAMTLRVEFWCTWDHRRRFLTVEKSNFRLGVKDYPDPLLRFEYGRELDEDTPVAHLQIHAHRDETSFLMTRADKNRPKARRRTDRMGVLSELHFPLGGHRYRPCLEDILHMVILEFGAKTVSTWRAELKAGRAEWRRLQLRTAVRDAPEAAAAVLRDAGYEVTWLGSEDPPGERIERFECF